MDGGDITAQNLAIWRVDLWVVENEGVPPGIEVTQTPAEVIEGHDPELEKALHVVMDELRENPENAHRRPAFPAKRKGEQRQLVAIMCAVRAAETLYLAPGRSEPGR